MRAPARVFARLESAPKHRMNPNRIEIIRRYDAAYSALGAVADAQRGPRDFAHEKTVNERGTPLQIQKVRPREFRRSCLAARRSRQCQQSLLMRYRRIRTKQNPFHPAEHRRIRPNPQSQAQNRQRWRSPDSAAAFAIQIASLVVWFQSQEVLSDLDRVLWPAPRRQNSEAHRAAPLPRSCLCPGSSPQPFPGANAFPRQDRVRDGGCGKVPQGAA